MATGTVTIGGKEYGFTRPHDRTKLKFLTRKNLGYLRLVQGGVELTKAQVADAEESMRQIIGMFLPTAPTDEISKIAYFAQVNIFADALEWLGMGRLK